MAKFTGSYTETKKVDVEVRHSDVVAYAYENFTDDEVLNIARNCLVRNFIFKDEELLSVKAAPDFTNNEWTKFWFVDYHKNEDVYETVRPFNDEEMLAFSIINDLKRQLK